VLLHLGWLIFTAFAARLLSYLAEAFADSGVQSAAIIAPLQRIQEWPLGQFSQRVAEGPAGGPAVPEHAANPFGSIVVPDRAVASIDSCGGVSAHASEVTSSRSAADANANPGILVLCIMVLYLGVEFSQSDVGIGNEQGSRNISITPQMVTTVLPIFSGPICNIMDVAGSLLFMP
jgi:hypothetical protein